MSRDHVPGGAQQRKGNSGVVPLSPETLNRRRFLFLGLLFSTEDPSGGSSRQLPSRASLPFPSQRTLMGCLASEVMTLLDFPCYAYYHLLLSSRSLAMANDPVHRIVQGFSSSRERRHLRRQESRICGVCSPGPLCGGRRQIRHCRSARARWHTGKAWEKTLLGNEASRRSRRAVPVRRTRRMRC